MSRNIPVPHLFESHKTFKFDDENDYACSMVVLNVIKYNSETIDSKFKYIHSLINYLFLIYSELDPKHNQYGCCSPNPESCERIQNNLETLSFDYIYSEINYYCDRWN